MLSTEQGQQLIKLAHQAISRALDQQEAVNVDLTAAWLKQPGATFVTLTKQGNLRGCIGSLEAWRPLQDDVVHNALAAAFSDPRFAPVSLSEWPGIKVEVSLLTPPQEMHFTGEEDAIAQLRPHIDGVMLEYGLNRGTFLPQVWDSLPDPHQFMRHLKLKAGLPANFWNDGLKLSHYEVQKWTQ